MEERLYFGGALFLLLFLSIFFFLIYLLWLTVEKCVMWAKKKKDM
jgi:hypothetical protein